MSRKLLIVLLHGLFEADAFRQAFLEDVAARRGKRFVSAGVSFDGVREQALEALADALEEHLDMTAIETMIASARPRVDVARPQAEIAQATP